MYCNVCVITLHSVLRIYWYVKCSFTRTTRTQCITYFVYNTQYVTVVYCSQRELTRLFPGYGVSLFLDVVWMHALYEYVVKVVVRRCVQPSLYCPVSS